jgi:hypothetical protein
MEWWLNPNAEAALYQHIDCQDFCVKPSRCVFDDHILSHSQKILFYEITGTNTYNVYDKFVGL